jgi:membrane protease YdiL (CAAX protease family)
LLGHDASDVHLQTDPLLTSLRSFTVLAYALTWALLGPWFYAYTVVFQQEPPSWLWFFAPLAFIGGWGPSLAAVAVSARRGGRSEVRRLLTPLFVWRVRARWYLLVFLLPPLVTAVSILVVDRGLVTLRQFDIGAAVANLPLAYALALPFGPLGEELGWRGFALPRLLSRFSPWTASLILGAIWTFWHGPMMLWMPGASMPSFMTLSMTSVVVYLVQLTAETGVMTLVFLRTNGSVLIAVLAHMTFNTAESVVFGGLPRSPVEHVRAVYLINVAILALAGLLCLFWLSRRQGDGSLPNPPVPSTGGSSHPDPGGVHRTPSQTLE